jgi:hypothetical protein
MEEWYFHWMQQSAFNRGLIGGKGKNFGDEQNNHGMLVINGTAHSLLAKKKEVPFNIPNKPL